MDWPIVLAVIFGCLVLLMFSGMPVAFAFLSIILVAAFLLFQGVQGPLQIVRNIYANIATFTLLPIVLFIFMGELMFNSGIGTKAVNIFDLWLGRMPGRLSLVAVGAGVILGTLTGVSIATVSILGSTIMPDMLKRRYSKDMTMGPILGSGGLAMLIPPSGMAVFVAVIGEIPVGKLLVATIIPALMLAALFAAYIITRCRLNPNLAPAYEVTPMPLGAKLIRTAKDILPIVFVIFSVIGIIFAGIATPSEAAATGAVAIFVVALIYRRVNWNLLKTSLIGTIRVSGMILMILIGAVAFGQVLSFSGAASGLAAWAAGVSVAPIVLIIGMQIIVLIMGCFMDIGAITMITMPIFMPIVLVLNFDIVWFGALMLINLEMAGITPPFGLSLFVMKGVAPPDVTMGDIWRSSAPFVVLDIVGMALIMVFPQVALWLPEMMA